jgi:hypothetical protein
VKNHTLPTQSGGVAMFSFPLVLRSLFACLALPASGADGDGWKSLFNGRDLNGWSLAIENTKVGEDPKGHIVVRDGVIHMYADTPEDKRGDFGVIVTDGTYSRFHLDFEYAWGTKKFEPRKQMLRDAGLLYHIADPNQRTWGIWPVSMECQIQEGDTADLVFLKVRGLTWMHPDPNNSPGQGEAGLLPESGGTPLFCNQQDHHYVGRYPVLDKLEGWNRVETIVHGSESAVHLVNGKVRSRLFRLTDDEIKPLSSGHIALQLEGAEIKYRNIRIRELAPPLAPASRYVALSHVRNISSATTELEIHNPGPAPVALDLSLIGSHPQLFQASLPPGTPAILAPDGRARVRIDFKPASDTPPARYSAGLQVGPPDLGTFIVLQGVSLAALEGINEPPLQRITDALGIPLKVGGSSLHLDTKAPSIGSGIAATALLRASAGPVRVTPVARFSPPGVIPLRWHARGDATRHPIATLAGSDDKPDAHQCLFPPWTTGAPTASFDPGTAPFSLVAETGHGATPLDPKHCAAKVTHPARVYPIHTFLGSPVTDAVLVGFEEATNGDYQDALFLIENVRPAGD